jgi:MtrB/PioB family decaheme-associated outer membrane protein
MQNRSLLLSIAVASCLYAAGASVASDAAPDTSEWACSKCPFPKGEYRATATAGVGYLDESSAKFGQYTGLDEKGGKVVADAEGTYFGENGYTLSYDFADLGLSSRSLDLVGGRAGAYAFGLHYDRVPYPIWDTTETVFSGVGSQDLTLPNNWVYGGSTSGMTTLNQNLRSVDVGYNRDRYGATGKYYWGPNLVLGVDYRRDERSGFSSQFGTIGSTSTQLLKPIDDNTDRVEAALRYQTERWFAEVAYNGSFYNTKAASLTWANPFGLALPGTDEGRMALAPDNDYNELAISAGWYGLPGNTTVSISAATGKGSQDVSYLPYTINPTISTLPLPMSNLDGDVGVTRADITVTSRPWSRLSLRGSVTYDERDDSSRQAAFDSIVYADSFRTVGAVTNPLYGFERTRFTGSADWEVWDKLQVGAGGEYRTLKRTGTKQEVSEERLADGWGRAEYRPTGYLGFVVRGGAMEREPSDPYDTAVAVEYGQNPLMRKYNMAYLYRSYGELVANVSLGELPLTLSASGFYADDSYTKSRIGLRSGIDRRYGIDLNWAVNDKVSAYVTGGQDKIDSKQWGSSTFSNPDWKGDVEDAFSTMGGGVSARLSDRLGFDLDYTFAQGNSHTTVSGVNAGSFPAVRSELSSVRADFEFDVTERMGVELTWWYERFTSSDWALQGIGPATLPNVLSLGADPYDYSVSYVTIAVTYLFGALPETE